MNDTNHIVGLALRGDGVTAGVVLTPVFVPPKGLGSSAQVVAKIMFGILGDGDGEEIVGGRWRHVGPGPDDPWRRVWNGLTHGQRDALLGAGIQGLASLVHDSSARAELERVGKHWIATASPSVSAHVGDAKGLGPVANVNRLLQGRFGKLALRRF